MGLGVTTTRSNLVFTSPEPAIEFAKRASVGGQLGKDQAGVRGAVAEEVPLCRRTPQARAEHLNAGRLRGRHKRYAVRSIDADPASWYGFSLVGAQRNTQEGRPEVMARTGPNVDRASPASAPGQSRVTARADGSTSLVSRSDLLRLQRTAGNSAVSALVSGAECPAL